MLVNPFKKITPAEVENIQNVTLEWVRLGFSISQSEWQRRVDAVRDQLKVCRIAGLAFLAEHPGRARQFEMRFDKMVNDWESERIQLPATAGIEGVFA